MLLRRTEAEGSGRRHDQGRTDYADNTLAFNFVKILCVPRPGPYTNIRVMKCKVATIHYQ